MNGRAACSPGATSCGAGISRPSTPRCLRPEPSAKAAVWSTSATDRRVVLSDGPGLGKLVWFSAPEWKRHELDTEIEMHDCAAATLFGQARFRHDPTVHADALLPGRWRGTGCVLVLHRVGAGRHRVRRRRRRRAPGYPERQLLDARPESFEQPWRLFAINTMHQTPKSARFRLALLEPADGLVAAQGEMEEAQVVLFRKPANPREQWPLNPLGEGLKLAYPHGLFASDLDGDGRGTCAGRESRGGSRLFALWNVGGDRFEPSLLATGWPALAIFRTAAEIRRRRPTRDCGVGSAGEAAANRGGDKRRRRRSSPAARE